MCLSLWNGIIVHATWNLLFGNSSGMFISNIQFYLGQIASRCLKIGYIWICRILNEQNRIQCVALHGTEKDRTIAIKFQIFFANWSGFLSVSKSFNPLVNHKTHTDPIAAKCGLRKSKQITQCESSVSNLTIFDPDKLRMWCCCHCRCRCCCRRRRRRHCRRLYVFEQMCR